MFYFFYCANRIDAFQSVYIYLCRNKFVTKKEPTTVSSVNIFERVPLQERFKSINTHSISELKLLYSKKS